MSPISSAVFPPSVLAKVDRPRPPIARLKFNPFGFDRGSGGGKPASESELLPPPPEELDYGEIKAFFLFSRFSFRTRRSPISSAVLPPSFFARVDNPNPPMARLRPSPFGLETGSGGGKPISESEPEAES